MSTLDVVTVQSQADETPPVFKDASGSREIVQGCWGWAYFNGTTPALTDSFNVTSLTDNGTGDYTVNWATNLPNVNYGVTVSSDQYHARDNSGIRAKAVGSISLTTFNSANAAADTVYSGVAVFCNP